MQEHFQFKGIANWGYCASKRMYDYGFKAHMQVKETGIACDRGGSVHAVTLGDKGYIHQKQEKQLENVYGTALCTPERSNCKMCYLKKLHLHLKKLQSELK